MHHHELKIWMLSQGRCAPESEGSEGESELHDDGGLLGLRRWMGV